MQRGCLQFETTSFFIYKVRFPPLNTAFLETIVYIWGNEHLPYSE